MGTVSRKPTKKQAVLLVVNALLVILALVCVLVSGHIRGMLGSQTAADRWSTGGDRYAQISAYIAEHRGLTAEQVESLLSGVNQNLDQQGFDLDMEGEDAQLWTHGYSGEGVLQVSSRYRDTIEAHATGVGGNFFLFNPVSLVSGAYFSGGDMNDDRVLIDQSLAWSLFGGVDVAGMEVYIGDRQFVIAGVFAREDDFASRAAYGEDMPRIFLSYSAMADLAEGMGITCFQAVLPDPITSFGADLLGEALEGIGLTAENFELVDNTNRYSFFSLVDVLGDFGSRSMRHVGLSLPYWENAARMVEDWAALLLLLTVLLLLFPAVNLAVLVVRLWKNRRWNSRTIREKVEDTLEERRERKHRELEAPEELGGAEEPFSVEKLKLELEGLDDAPQGEEPVYDVSEIIRSVRESEDYLEQNLEEGER